jgi:multidrug efflux pump subunit AcrB
MVESVGEDDDGEVRSGNIFVQLVKPNERKLSQKQFEAQLTKELRVIPDARLTFQSQSDGGGRDLTLFVVGSNPDAVEQTARTAIEQMRTLKELRDPRINGDMARPELVIHPRLDLAAQLGVTVPPSAIRCASPPSARSRRTRRSSRLPTGRFRSA